MVANFAQTFTIAVSASPTAGGTASGGGTFNSGATITVTATPNSGYAFVNWTEGGSVVSTQAGYPFTVTANRTLVANFAPQTFNIGVSANPPAGGSATGGGTYSAGSTATVVATANSGYVFVNWTEGGSVVSTQASYPFTVTGNRTLVANFALTTYTIAVIASPTAGGTATGGGTYNAGSTATVVATANAGYAFVNWTDGGSVVSTQASYPFTVTGNRTLVANFVQTFTIAVSASPAAGGTVSGNGTFNSGSSRTVTATANSGYAFVNWTEGGNAVSTSASYTFTLTANRTLVANFVQTYTITVTPSPSTGGTVGGGGTFNAGSSRTVSATPNTGFSFVNWTEGGSVVSTQASYTFTLTANRALVANFVANYTIAVSAAPPAGGTVAGGGTFVSGSSHTVTASPRAGCTFANWTENGSLISSSASYPFTLTINRNLVANFVTSTQPVIPCYAIADRRDFNGDGKSDILWRNDSGEVMVWLMNGGQVLSSTSVTTLSDDWKILGTGDFNLDRKHDVLLRRDSGEVAIWLMNGAAIAQNTTVATVPAELKIAGIGDFNGDGKSDILWRNDNGEVTLWLMNGATIQQNATVRTVGAEWKIEGIGDFDGDGKSDILWRNDNGALAIWFMDGAQVPSSVNVASGATELKIAGVADVDGDGKSDIVWPQRCGGIQTWLMNGGQFRGLPLQLAESWLHAVALGDFNADGKSDVLWRDEAGGVELWLMSGTQFQSVPVGLVSKDWHIIGNSIEPSQCPPVVVRLPGLFVESTTSSSD